MTFVNTLYTYCTDFIINVAILSATSYYEINTALFLFFWPIITFFLLVLFFIQVLRYTRLRYKYSLKRH